MKSKEKVKVAKRTSLLELVGKLQATDNPVTMSVYKDIIRNRLDSGVFT